MVESCLTDACFFWNKSSVLKSILVSSSYRSWMRSIPRRPKPVISRQEVLGHCSSWPTRHKLSNYGEKVCHVSSQHLIFTLCLYLFYEKEIHLKRLKETEIVPRRNQTCLHSITGVSLGPCTWKSARTLDPGTWLPGNLTHKLPTL